MFLLNFLAILKIISIKLRGFCSRINFYNYKTHGHAPSQYPKVICWDIPASGRKAKLNKTSKRYKFTVNEADFQVHVFVLKMMDGIKIMSRQEIDQEGIDF